MGKKGRRNNKKPKGYGKKTELPVVGQALENNKKGGKGK